MISLFVSHYVTSLNTSNYLKSLFSTISLNLEGNKWGSRFPIIMNELYGGKVVAEHLEEAKRELKDISRDIKQFTSEDAVVDLIKTIQKVIDDGIYLKASVYMSISDDWDHKRDWRDYDEEKLFRIKNDKFTLKGVRECSIRTDEELELIDKDKADEAFKTQKKKIDAFLQQKGFVKFKTSSYLRRNKLDVLEYVDLQKDRYGSKTFTVNYALIPLYTPHSFFYYDLMDRLGILIRNKDTWWDYADGEIAEISFRNVIDAMEIFLMPWFEEKQTKVLLKEELLREKKERESYGSSLSNAQQSWLEAIDSNEDFSEIIKQNIEKFKLPKKLQ